jgi:hypothetical protein
MTMATMLRMKSVLDVVLIQIDVLATLLHWNNYAQFEGDHMALVWSKLSMPF